jgi:exodeoxyribonuclease V gamma subunit
LPSSRFSAEEVLGWLAQPALASQAGIDPEDFPLLRDWLRDAGVRWGREAAQRAQLGLPAEAAFTWQQGLDRLLLGFVAPPQLAGNAAPLLGDSWPLDALEGARAQLLGRLIGFVQRLGAWAHDLQRPRSLAEWADSLQDLLDSLIDEREAGDTLLLLSKACAALREQGLAAGVERPLELALIHQQLTSALEQGSGASGFLTGAVTFCTMVPMRSLPFKWVCLLGLDDGALPRRSPAVGFDLISQQPRRGDRARRLDDRYLLLETLLSARAGLYLSYVGRDQQNNAHLPPSVLLSELLEVVDQTAMLACRSELARDPAATETSRASSLLQEPPARTVSEHIRTVHPLQPFAPSNFNPTGALQSYSSQWFRAAQRLAAAPELSAPAFIGSLPEPSSEGLTIEPAQLLQCFKNPARFLLEQRLGVRIAQSEQLIGADEPFALEGSARSGLRKLALQAVEQGWSEATERRIARAAGWLPAGEVGNALWGQVRGPLLAFAPKLFAARPVQTAQPLHVDIELAGVRVLGWLDCVTDCGLFEWRLIAPGAWDLPSFWLRHLLLNLSANAAIACDSLLLTPNGDWKLGPLANPAELLEPWLAAYREALLSPLGFIPRSSVAFAKALCTPSKRSKKDPLEAAREGARFAWLGSEFSNFPAEAEDPWNALAYRDRQPLDERFEALAEQLLGPALQALAADDEDEA